MAAIAGSSLRDDFRFPGNPREEYLCDGSLEDDIVITGMSGRFPQSDNVTELMENLFRKHKLYDVPDVRWAKTHMTSNNRRGLLQDVSKFDASFFKLRSSQVNTMNPAHRILLEVCHETIVDAGYDPATLSGKRIGVFIGVNDPDIDTLASKLKLESSEKTHFSNNFCSAQVSFSFNFKGCCMTIDTACSSSLVALDQAVTAIKSGAVDAAIVGGSKLTFDPESGAVLEEFGIVSPTGHCRPFDSRSNGMVPSEAISTLFVQKAKDARRIYAKVLGVVSMSSGYSKEGMFHPCKSAQVDVMETCLRNTKVKPSEVKYVEAHGTGTKVGDPIEIESFEEVFCKDRKVPLLVGSVKSNLGHSECGAGVTGIIKAVIAYETGMIPPNADFIEPNPQCEALINGKIKVVAEATPFEGSLTAVMSYGIGGVVASTLLERNKKKYEQTEQGKSSYTQIVLYGATTEEALKNLFQTIQLAAMPREFFSLLHKSAYISPESNIYRGYVVLDQIDKPKPCIERVPMKKRQVWYVVTGMGCQWSGMGLDLMQIDAFAKSMKRSAKTLEPLGIDLLELLNPKMDYLHRERNITPAFVTITAIQIALVDILKELGIEPDGIVGHSAGEIVCSYIDGCSTAEQAILASYYRGYATENSKLIRGEMAVVGLSWEETKARCPDGVFAACNNAQESVTISGYKEEIEKFIEQLKTENVFARKVAAYGYAFHCPGMNPAGGLLESKLRKVYSNPKQRSPRWISTSYEEQDWKTPECKTVNAAYFTHNLLSQVHFYEALRKIPSDAITIEIGPHNLLKSILKMSIGPEGTTIGLMRRKENNVHYLLSSIGQLYNLGLNPQAENLYPPVSYPVPRGTPMISSLIKWNHSQTWFTPTPPTLRGDSNAITIDTDGKDRYLLDHCVDGRPLYPAAGYIFLAWTSICNFFGREMTETPIVIEDMKILRATILKKKGTTKFQVDMRFANGDFEISEEGSAVATGRIYFPSGPLNFDIADLKKHDDSSMMVEGQEMYKELKILGYKYGPFFQSIQEMEIKGHLAYVAWRNKWIPFIDAMLLPFGFRNPDGELRLPTAIQSLKIDPIKFLGFLSKAQENEKVVPVSFNASTRVCTAPGLEISDLRMEPTQRRKDSDTEAYLEEYCFVPYMECDAMDLQIKQKFQEYIDTFLQEASSLPLPTELKYKIQHLKIKSKVRYKSENIFDHNDPKYVMLSAVKEIRSTLEKKCDASRIKRICEYYLEHIKDDILNRNLLEGTAMKSLVDVVLENSGRRLTVVELCDSGPTLSIVVHDMLNALTQIKLNCTLIQRNALSHNVEDLKSRNVKVEEMSQIYKKESVIKYSAHLVLGSFVMGCKDSLTMYIRHLVQMTGESGFIILAYKYGQTVPEMFLSILGDCPMNIQTQLAVELEFKKENLMLIAKKSGRFGSCIYLLRKYPLAEKRNSEMTVVPILDGNYSYWVEKLKSAMNTTQETDEESTIWLVAEDSPTNGIMGLVNCLKQEPGGDKIRCVFINDGNVSSPAKFDINSSHFSEVLRKNLLVNVYRNECWGSFRHNHIPKGQRIELTEHAEVNCVKLGDLSSFAWFASPNNVQLSSKKPLNQKILCHVYYSALNFKDVMIATGRIQRGAFEKNDTFIGFEFSGRDASGRRIFGFSEQTALATTTLCHPDCIIEVPDHWSLEKAATVYIVYATAYYALLDKGRLTEGEKILIHSGAGGVGQAAIRIASSFNCEIFTTVGTEEKKTFLMNTFPHLKPENIGCSHDISFERMVMSGTDGKGVDIVLNSLSEDKLKASVRCLGINGRFLEIGKYDMAMDHNLGLRPFLKNLSFHGVMVDIILSVGEERYGYFREVSKYLREGLKQGVIKPLNTTVFGSDEIGDAFRYMASGKHIGKVVVKIREEESEKILRPSPLKVLAIKKLHFYPDKVYIVIGGLGGFGIELTKWLIRKGARNVILTSRYGARTPYHYLCLKRWEDQGANVQVSTLNVIKKDSAEELLREASAYAPVGGIFNSALVLKDAFLENQTVERFADVCAPKALATKHLDDLTRRMCSSLDFFVCFSSVSCGKGNAGQSNYGYANSVMERICELRQKDGLHGLAIQWGIIDDVGIVHRQFGEDAVIAGVKPQKVEHCLRTLEGFLLESRPVVSSFVKANVSNDVDKSEDMLSRILKLFNLNEPSAIDKDISLKEFGIDSLAVTELQNILQTETDVRFSISEIKNMNFGDLKDMNDKIKREETSSKRTYLNEIKISPRANVSNTEAVFPLNDHKNGKPMIAIHGNDLLLHGLIDLSNRTKRPMYGIQCTEDTPMRSLKDLVHWYQEEIFKVVSDSTVTLIGCSTGGILALEIALQDAQLKKSLNIGSVVILDGAMEVIDILNDTEKKTESEAKGISDIMNFISEFSDCDLSQLTNELKLFPSLESKLNRVIDLVTSTDPETFDRLNFARAIKKYASKQRLMRTSCIDKKFSKDLTVIEAAEKCLPNDISLMKSSMSKICDKKISVHRLGVSDEFLADDSSIAEIAQLLENA